MNKKAFWYPTVLALITAIISGVSNFINKIGVTVVFDPVVYTTIKNSLVAIFLIGIILVLKKWKEIKILNRHQILKLITVGVVGGSIPFVLFFTGLAHTSAINASLIHKTLFVWVALLAIPFLKEKIRMGVWAGISIVFIANLFVGGFSGFKFNSGEVMIFIATIFWAIESIIAKKALQDISSITLAGARMVVGSLLLFIIVAVQGNISEVFSLGATQWGWTLLSSVFLLGYVVTWYTALQYAPAWYVATLLVPATLVTNILTTIFITQTISWQQAVSGGLYLVGIIIILSIARKTFKSNVLIPSSETNSENF